MLIAIISLVVLALMLNIWWIENRAVNNINNRDPKYITPAYIELLMRRENKYEYVRKEEILPDTLGYEEYVKTKDRQEEARAFDKIA